MMLWLHICGDSHSERKSKTEIPPTFPALQMGKRGEGEGMITCEWRVSAQAHTAQFQAGQGPVVGRELGTPGIKHLL